MLVCTNVCTNVVQTVTRVFTYTAPTAIWYTFYFFMQFYIFSCGSCFLYPRLAGWLAGWRGRFTFSWRFVLSRSKTLVKFLSLSSSRFSINGSNFFLIGLSLYKSLSFSGIFSHSVISLLHVSLSGINTWSIKGQVSQAGCGVRWSEEVMRCVEEKTRELGELGWFYSTGTCCKCGRVVLDMSC